MGCRIEGGRCNGYGYDDMEYCFAVVLLKRVPVMVVGGFEWS